MKKSLLAIASAAVIAAAPLAPAFAQGMDEGLSMLEAAVNNQFNALGIENVDMGTLTLSQLAEIRNVVGNSERNNAEKRQQIEVILNR